MLTKPRNVCRWVDHDPVTGNPILLINSTPYEVETVLGGYRLHHLDERTYRVVTYMIEVLWFNAWRCDCPDAQHRDPCACKHVKSLKAALKAKSP
jgi:hypothetical protein